jgi:hypothetical protein
MPISASVGLSVRKGKMDGLDLACKC